MTIRPVLILAVSLAAVSCRPEVQRADRLPADSAQTAGIIPRGPLGDAIRRGRALVQATRESLPASVGNRLRCVSCHLDDGRRAQGTWVGVYGRFPQYRARRAAVELIEDRINDCFRRSLNGRSLAPDGRDMRDIVAYLAFLSRGVPAAPPPPAAPSRFASLVADTIDGAAVFAKTCALCHGANGEGTLAAPPAWGPQSFNIGAGMARRFTAAAFVQANMPFATPGTLTDQQALDVAAYVTSRPRPDYPDKQYDWPNGGAPPDVAYRTLGRPKTPERR